MKIGQLSQQSGLSTHTIRYYEKLGLLKPPQKDTSGHRHYSTQDLELVNWVNCLKKSGMPLQAIKQFVSAENSSDTTTLQQLLQQHLDKLYSQQQDINHYIDVTEAKLKKL